MSVFRAAVDALFADPDIASDVVYVAAGGTPKLVRAVLKRADEVTGFGQAQIWSETQRVDLRVADIPDPRPGDRVEIEGAAFLIQGEPMRDAKRLIWTVDLRPA